MRLILSIVLMTFNILAKEIITDGQALLGNGVKYEGAQDSTHSRCYGEMIAALCNFIEGLGDNEEFAKHCSEIMPCNDFDYDGRGVFILDSKEDVLL